MARRKVSRYREDFRDLDELALDQIFRDPNPLDALAANIEAGQDLDDLGRKLP